MRYSIVIISLLFAFGLTAQTQKQIMDSVNTYENYTVTGFNNIQSGQTALNLEAYNLQKINDKLPMNLSDALAKIPGISQMTTGASISKPVVRGLFGNRVLILLSGARFDNQQWQDEHGLGLSQIGIDRVEIIKGPASILYGSDAVGAVINVIEERPIAKGQKIDFGSVVDMNTMGVLSDLGFAKRTGNKWKRLRIGLENHADYSDGNGNRIDNSRNRGYYLKMGFGFERAKWKQENSFNSSYNQFGFIMEDWQSNLCNDARWVRSMHGPHHNVLLNVFNSQNTFKLKQSQLKANIGWQSNLRMEDEGGGQISLNMHLMSGLQSLKWERQLAPHSFLVLNQQLTLSNNTNYGGRKLIPDANTLEANWAAYLRQDVLAKQWTIELGYGTAFKHIKTFLTPSLNGPNEMMGLINYAKIGHNVMLGSIWHFGQKQLLKFNSATGYRAPSLAELSSNGVHEGVYRYEIGDPNLQLEQNWHNDLTYEFSSKYLYASVSAYQNQFKHYIFLNALGDSIYRFPKFQYQQCDANIQGFEAVVNWHPFKSKWTTIKQAYVYTHALMSNGQYLPFIPANKYTVSLRFENKTAKKSLFFEPELVVVAKQSHLGVFETATAAYHLVNLYTGLQLTASSKMGFVINNLSNTVYVDHLSRLKYVGINNMGRNICISFRKQF